jgi:hypothetical protein
MDKAIENLPPTEAFLLKVTLAVTLFVTIIDRNSCGMNILATNLLK